MSISALTSNRRKPLNRRRATIDPYLTAATGRALIERALGYPYAPPTTSYMFVNGAAAPLSTSDLNAYKGGRTPVLAVGSNQGPEQLARKYHGHEWGVIPCERATLHGFDSVYSAHIAAYGSVAAALHPSPGTDVTLFVNWLTDRQLDRMTETEVSGGNYDVAVIADISLNGELGTRLSEVAFYVSRHGAFAPRGEPLALAEVSATNRKFQAFTQIDVQNTVRSLIEPEHSLDHFVTQSVEHHETRQQRKKKMADTAIPFAHPGFQHL